MTCEDEKRAVDETIASGVSVEQSTLALIAKMALLACGFGFYWAWLMLSFYVDPAMQASANNAWLFGSGGHSVALGLILFGPERLHAFVRRRLTVLVCGALVAVGTLTPLLDWSALPALGAMASVLACSGWLLTGLGTAVLVVAWGSCFVGLEGKDVLVVNALALVEACLIHFLAFSAILPVLVSVMVVLPAASAVLLVVVMGRFGDRVGSDDQAAGGRERRTIARFSPKTLIPLGGMFFFAFCGELLRNAASYDIGVTGMGLLYDLGLLTGALVCLLSELVLRRRTLGYQSLFGHLRLLFIVMAFSFMVCTVLDMSFGFAYLCYAIGFAGLRIYAWVVCIDLVRSLRINVLRVAAAMILSFSLGPLLASLLELVVPMSAELWSDLSFVLVFGTLVVVTEILNRDNYQDAWGLSEANTISVEDKAWERGLGGTFDGQQDAFAKMELRFDEFGLTPREREVARLLVGGRSLPYIADSLSISLSTAQTHQRHIYEKADVHDRQKFLDSIAK